MDVSRLPFNQLIGLKLAEEGSPFQTELASGRQYTNHLGTVHASAQLALAEAASGAFLAQQFKEYTGLIPVVRRLEAKFRKPATGQISARCAVDAEALENWKQEINNRTKVMVSVPVEVVDEIGNIVMTATVEWFVSKVMN